MNAETSNARGEPFAYVVCEGTESTNCAELQWPRQLRKGPRGAKAAWRDLPPGIHPLYLTVSADERRDAEHDETMRAAKLLAIERAEFRIRAERAEAKELAQWRTIDTAREAMSSGEAVLLYSASWSVRRLVGGWDAHEKAWRIYGFGCPSSQPTHWMPLPAPPGAES